MHYNRLLHSITKTVARTVFFTTALLVSSQLSATASSTIFKEYDIRGVVGTEFDTKDSYDMALATATYFQRNYPEVKTIAIGRDGRVHSQEIANQVTSALRKMGYDVVSIGTCTTPILYYTLYTDTTDAGIMVTASHNPGEYNGLKISIGTHAVAGSEIRAIRDIYLSRDLNETSAKEGSFIELDLVTPYVDNLVKSFPHLQGKEINAIIDCGNGAAGCVLPQLIAKMGWSFAHLLYPEVDGTYPHHIADPTVEKYMHDLKQSLQNSSAHLGIGFDGDCDRMAPMTKQGRLVKGDQLLTLHAKEIIKKNPGANIVFDISSSKSLLDTVNRWGGNAVLAQTGAVHVKGKMQALNAPLAGEISCHTIFNDRYFGFDDGIYSMMRLLELLDQSEQTLETLLDQLPKTISSPTYRLPCERAICNEIIADIKQAFNKQNDCTVIDLDGVRLHLPYGWAIVRASNTEPLISIRFEADSEQELQLIRDMLQNVIGERVTIPIS